MRTMIYRGGQDKDADDALFEANERAVCPGLRYNCSMMSRIYN